MNDLDLQVLQAVTTTPGRQAKQIAAQLGFERQAVNSALYGSLKSKVRQDKSYRWYTRDSTGIDGKDDVSPRPLDTTLGRLCRYYLDCLSHDDLGGVSEFASSKFGGPSYAELGTLPMFDANGTDPFETEQGRQLLARVRRDRNRQTIFLGYPIRLKLVRSRKGWEGFMVEPLLLFSYQESDTKFGAPTLSDDLPQINFSALRSLSNTGGAGLLEEGIQLADELGLANAPSDQPDLDELLVRLQEIRRDWDWQETIDPYSLSSGAPLWECATQGILNRAILVAAERSPYTKGLESELGMLQSLEEPKYAGTALGAWLGDEPIAIKPADEHPLVEVIALNSEQRQAVRQALANPLTVITGPPGTGKSQVVTSILVNAAWHGKTVLFASKNNKAVDVVETRVNALGSRPVLLRLGANQYQTALAEYLVSLLASSATAADQEQYKERSAIHDRLQRVASLLDGAEQALIDTRNEVDRLEQQVESIRQVIGQDAFVALQNVDCKKLQRTAETLLKAVDRGNKSKQSLFARTLWPMLRRNRFERLAQAAAEFREQSQQIRLPMPAAEPDSITMSQWLQYGDLLRTRVPAVAEASQYLERLSALTRTQSLEDLAGRRLSLTDEFAENSAGLWEAWVRLQPARLDQAQRKLLGDYSALLQLIVSANATGRNPGGDTFRRYYQLFPKITSILSCWAVTSLSARGRVPFEPGFFDLLVIDEASQCDIASLLPLLYRVRQVVVIGDPKQLRHISTLSKRKDQQLLAKHALIDDHAGWAYSVRSAFDLASSLCNSDDIIALRDHHRSHADIIGFSNEFFYERRLRVATRYDRLRSPADGTPALRWVDVKGETVRPESGGAVNSPEAQAVVDEIERLVRQGYRGSVGVVSPFRAQANRIRDLVNAREDLASGVISLNFLVDTVHKFQGDERDVIIFSPTVSSGISDGALGFLRSNPNLFNVAITRARAALVVVGDKSAALNCGVDYLARFAAYVEEVGMRQPVEVTTDEPGGPEYPVTSHADKVSDWERVFYAALYRKGIRPMPQYAVEQYVLDFAIVEGERRLNIEVDGERYHRNWDGELCRRDQIRNQRMMELGWDVMRFWVYQIRDDSDACVARVENWIRGAS